MTKQQKIVYNFIMLFFLLLGCQDPKRSDFSSEGNLSFLTYNVHGLPEQITGDNTSERISSIGPLLNQFDVVGLQEIFDDEDHQTLVANSTHQTHLRFSEKIEDSRFYGSGLSIFANGVVDKFQHEHYEDCNGITDASGDCLASKGFQLARIKLQEDFEIDVLNTHLEAGGGEEDHQIRISQVEHIITTCSDWSSNRPLLFLGDTNLHPSDSTEAQLIEELMEALNLQDSCEQVDCGEINHIDRILYRSSSELQISISQWQNEPNFYDENNIPLSDHLAISVSIAWQKNTE